MRSPTGTAARRTARAIPDSRNRTKIPRRTTATHGGSPLVTAPITQDSSAKNATTRMTKKKKPQPTRHMKWPRTSDERSVSGGGQASSSGHHGGRWRP